MMNTKIIDVKTYKNDEVGILVQVVLTELLIIFAIIDLMSDKFMPAFYAIIVMLMFTMAYNNNRIYKRKYMTPIYIVVGIFVLITTIIEYVI